MEMEYLNFCPRLKEIVETGESIDFEGNLISVSGTSTLNNIRIIREILISNNFKDSLEIGLAYGASALAILSTLNEISDGDFHHSAIDPFQLKTWKGSSLRVIEEEGYSEHFQFYEDYSAFVLPELDKDGSRFDFIYVDGSHIFEDVFVDLYFSARLLKPKGIILFDDCTDKHVHKVMRFVRTNYNSIFKEIPYQDYESPNKSIKKKIGNALGIRQLVGFQKINEPPREWNVEFKNF